MTAGGAAHTINLEEFLAAPAFIHIAQLLATLSRLEAAPPLTDLGAQLVVRLDEDVFSCLAFLAQFGLCPAVISLRSLFAERATQVADEFLKKLSGRFDEQIAKMKTLVSSGIVPDVEALLASDDSSGPDLFGAVHRRLEARKVWDAQAELDAALKYVGAMVGLQVASSTSLLELRAKIEDPDKLSKQTQ